MDEEFDGLEAVKETRGRRGRRAESAGAKVTVACNIPNGLSIRRFKMIEGTELVLGGGVREIKLAEEVGERIKINGTAVPYGKAPAYPIVAGYAITEGVDKEAWDHWLADNAKSAMVRNNCVFAYERQGDTEGAARELKGTLSGLQPFLKDGDPRRPRMAPNLSEVTEEDGRAAA